MLKKIIALLLATATLFAFGACGDKDNSESSKTENSADVSTDASADASTDASQDASQDTEVTEYVDKEGYEQFLKVSKVDKVLAAAALETCQHSRSCKAVSVKAANSGLKVSASVYFFKPGGPFNKLNLCLYACCAQQFNNNLCCINMDRVV